MDCPKCSADMEIVEHLGINIDRCANRGGIWLDYLELERLREVPDSASIDLATNADAGFDEMVYVECPRCFSILDQEESGGDDPLTYGVCRICRGSFLDGGELRRLLSQGWSACSERSVAWLRGRYVSELA